MSSLFSMTRTFKPKKVAEGTKQYQLRRYAEQTLGSGNLRSAVALPEGEDANEWIAVHVVDFFNHVNMLYGTITEFCNPQKCPTMNAGAKYEFLWEDGDHYRKPTALSAPLYVENLMTWIQNQLDDEKLFPQKIGVPFPRNYSSVCRTILRRLFRVYAHIYYEHFDQICALGIEAHLNTNYRHFYLFVTEFNLVDKKDMAPLDEFNRAIDQEYK
ncbi:Mitotic exit network component [Naganishia albida]|nr:Mitotic exit network component [Naganishia albida]